MVEHDSKDIEAIRYLLVEDPVVLVDVSDVSVFFVGTFSREFGLLVNAVKWSVRILALWAKLSLTLGSFC